MSAEKVLHTSDGVSIRDYIDLRFGENQRAIDKAEAAMQTRLASMNEFRDALKDASAKFVTRDEISMIVKPMNDEIRILRSSLDKATGRASTASFVSIAGLILAIVVAIVSFTK